jgi:hypothetical protein
MMVDYKKFAMVLGIMVLLPLFLGLFFDAVYNEPKYEDFCKSSRFAATAPMKSGLPAVNCTTDPYNSPEALQCMDDKGEVRTKPDQDNCQVFDKCDYCSRDYNDARAVYNRNLFFMLAPIGLLVIIIGIYFSLDYMGAGIMLGGLITLFYATIRYFSDMSKLLRALVILVELLIILWIGYKKIDRARATPGKEANNSPSAKRKGR